MTREQCLVKAETLAQQAFDWQVRNMEQAKFYAQLAQIYATMALAISDD
jgi:hypothetical protein